MTSSTSAPTGTALKVLLPDLAMDADSRARFELEARAAGTISSEHLVDVLDAGVDDDTGLPFLVMDLLEGEDVAAFLARRGRLPWDEALALLRQIAAALERVHAAGLVHRDLKPENLFISRHDDGSPLVKLLDFGAVKVVVARSIDAHTTRNLGTPLYMAPEQLEGDGRIDGRADVWALGHLAYAMLVGEAYFAHEARISSGVYPILLAVGRGVREPASVRAARARVALPAGFDAWFARAAARDPAARFPGAAVSIDALATCSSARTSLFIAQFRMRLRSSRFLLAALVGCAIAALLALATYHGGSPAVAASPLLVTAPPSRARPEPTALQSPSPSPSGGAASSEGAAPPVEPLGARSASTELRRSAPRAALRKVDPAASDDQIDFR